MDVIAKSICLYDSIDHKEDDPIEGRYFQDVRYAFLTSLKQQILTWVENINFNLSLVGFEYRSRMLSLQSSTNCLESDRLNLIWYSHVHALKVLLLNEELFSRVF